MRGMDMSVIIRSGTDCASLSYGRKPIAGHLTSYRCSMRIEHKTRVICGSSSTPIGLATR